MGNVLSPYSFSLQGGYPQSTTPETYGTIQYPLTWDGWTYDSQNGGNIVLGPANTLTASYPIPIGGSGVYAWAIKNVASENTRQLYIEFQAKMPANPHGLKFLKIFGQDSGSNYANSTFGLKYTGGDNGSLYQVSFGDGSGLTNDTSSTIWLDGTHLDSIGRSFGTATVSTPQNKSFASTDWGTDWHTFRMMLKFNSGTTSENEVADGEYFLEIDGDVYVDATGLFNRHYSNLPIQKVNFFDYSQDATTAFDISVRNPRVSTEGFA